MRLAFPQRALMFAACLAGARVASAQYVVPTFYTNTAPENGTYTYQDAAHTKLTDGIVGANDWTADLGSGNAHEWVGWQSVDPTLTFTFSTSQTIRSVQIGFNRGEGTGAIYLPTSVTIGGSSFSLNGTELADNTRGYLQFDGEWTGTTLQIDIPHVSGRWVFVDEVKFSTTTIPEPAVSALLAGLAAASWIAAWRKRASWSREKLFTA